MSIKKTVIKYDFTVVCIGETPLPDLYETPLSECPVCHKTGQEYVLLDTAWLHKIALWSDDDGETGHGPVVVLQHCDPIKNVQVFGNEDVLLGKE